MLKLYVLKYLLILQVQVSTTSQFLFFRYKSKVYESLGNLQ